MTRDDAYDLFRTRCLEAMDSAAREIFHFTPLASRNDVGAADQDLPLIFPTLDAQVDRLAERYRAFFDDDAGVMTVAA